MACIKCNGTGSYRKIANEEEYDRLFDKYIDSGQFDGESAHRMAIEKVGYIIEPCQYCEKGKELKEKLNSEKL